MRSDKSDKREHNREKFELDKSVRRYQKERPIDDLERSFEYKSEEESIY